MSDVLNLISNFNLERGSVVNGALYVHASDYSNYNLVWDTFNHPIQWLRSVLKNMTGFSWPSGYALIDKHNCIVKQIWVGSKNEYVFHGELSNLDCYIYIHSFCGPEHSVFGWKGVERDVLERTFDIKFDDENISLFGDFPSILTMSY